MNESKELFSESDEQPDEITLDSSKKQFLSFEKKESEKNRLKKEHLRKRQSKKVELKRLSSTALQKFSDSLKEIQNNEEESRQITNQKEKKSTMKKIAVKTKVFDNISVISLNSNINPMPINKSLLLFRESKIKKGNRAPVNAFSFAVSKSLTLNR